MLYFLFLIILVLISSILLFRNVIISRKLFIALETNKQTAYERAVNECLHALLSPNEEQNVYEKIAEIVGTSLKADRCFIHKINKSNRSVTKYAIWSLIDVVDSEIPDFNPEDYDKAWNYLNSYGCVDVADIVNDDSLANKLMKSTFNKKNVKSILVYGIYDSGELCAMIGVDYISKTHICTDMERETLHSVAGMVEVFMQRGRVLEKLEQKEATQRIILDSIELPIRLYDNEPKLQFVNAASSKSVGKSVEEILSKPCYETFCKRESMGAECDVKKSLETGNPLEFPGAHSGKEFIIKVIPIKDKSGKITNILEYNIDVTTFNENSRKLLKALNAAQVADKAKSYFLATMSHELRTPLNAVIGYSELMQDEELTPLERVENLKNINFAAKALLSLINDVLDLSKLEANQLKLTEQSVDIVHLIEDLIRIFRFSAEAKNIGLNVNFSKNFPRLKLDSLRMKQVLINIIGNAIKFTDAGSVLVNLSFNPTNYDTGVLKISVEDTGIGIAEDFIPKIYDPFERSGGHSVKGQYAYEGTGLGLPISQRLVKQMGGDIELESELGKGSKFTVILPNSKIAFGEEEKPAEAKVNPKETVDFVSALGEDHNVVIIDDVAMNLSVLGAVLKKLNIKYTAYTNAKDAYEDIKTNKPSIILTDLWMPEMTGMELAKAIKDNKDVADIPLVAITADTQFKDDSLGFEDILLKPISVKGISEVIAKVLSKQKN